MSDELKACPYYEKMSFGTYEYDVVWYKEVRRSIVGWMGMPDKKIAGYIESAIDGDLECVAIGTLFEDMGLLLKDSHPALREVYEFGCRSLCPDTFDKLVDALLEIEERHKEARAKGTPPTLTRTFMQESEATVGGGSNCQDGSATDSEKPTPRFYTRRCGEG